uniref:Uncharacterized protein n=1 Tax=Phaeomonas parva TaxID=124430 RepID=A0A7S1TZ98_9STRA|mmetsp:Transcript_24747/g.77606  ORF Transcript_24747/g.77606 Transcript_24747/m.77606 type:complete len:481 (+) Transcript_24747:154-1596(+)|eukprot:CAMPEP_0118875194 /NCGR_PEP_ID=MMETSP1163-20130328/16238_1 /TAXON_ID=124430 /ORGANISM="Phaeomonas parva, Strain CCMP2877" /LENGTH=480 /DNA_ID=CAMNT_0006810655 /DNA_START=110 /DNA_END=1552 /DNA_ORIENTATION=+
MSGASAGGEEDAERGEALLLPPRERRGSAELEGPPLGLGAAELARARMAFVLFGFSSWSALNALWLELPEMYNVVPEGYELATYMLGALALTNLVPISLAAMPRRLREALPLPRLITGDVMLAAVLCFLLAAFWDVAIEVGGVRHSLPLLVLVAAAGVANNTSTVLYWPWVGRQGASWTRWMGIGEGCSGLVPGLLALVQGAGSGHARFSASTFFVVIGCLNCVALAGFLHLRALEAKGGLADAASSVAAGAGADAAATGAGEAEDDDAVKGADGEAVGDGHLQDSSPLLRSGADEGWRSSLARSVNSGAILVYATQSWLAFWLFGIIQSVNSYATSGYPQAGTVLLGCTAIGFFMDPIGRATVGSVAWLSLTRPRHLLAPIIVFTASAAFILLAAAMSPEPPLHDAPGGAVLIVLCSGVCAYLFGLMNTSVYIIGRHIQSGPKPEDFNWTASAALQAGSVMGAAFSVLFVVYLKLFTSA